MAEWIYAASCNLVYVGSIPAQISINYLKNIPASTPTFLL